MQVIRLYKYTMLRRLAWAVVLVLLCMVPVLVLADKPPDVLFKHVTSTSQLVHQGDCKVDSMKVKETPCLIFYNASIDRMWVVLFAKDKDDNNYVTHVLLVDEIGKEVVAWCHERVCV